ncbi:cell cycle control protein 50A isoform X1 [Leptopilina heterotoma]|uniref:cell cycle control protein 50A isoform X1 n=1 Tax=Leptopilina heterotoma TaxID=63436 RepID=UPI001CA7F6EE|nr:cell cycle control protein 50A isoform X1 [Leptopilina heterotoma]
MSTSTNDINSSPSKTKKPADSAFKQQRLPAWQPILTAGTVLPTFFVIGIAFIPVGIGLLYFSDEVREHTTDYTYCVSNNTLRDFGEMCTKVIQKDPTLECFCEINIELPTAFFGNVYMYYGLTNFYQNHRRYVKSRDDNQLLGEVSDVVSTDCIPFAYEGSNTKPIVPCGAIANSLFSDELSLLRKKDNETVPLLRTGIAWPSDKRIKFRNPDGNLSEIFKDNPKPKNWSKFIYQLDLENEDNNGFQNEDLIVWMRTAALPTFRKLYRRIDHSKAGFRDGLVEGNYTLIVKYSFSVYAFEGSKRMILSTTSLLGGKNPFLGIAYIVVGCICLVMGLALLIIHIKCSKSRCRKKSSIRFMKMKRKQRVLLLYE